MSCFRQNFIIPVTNASKRIAFVNLCGRLHISVIPDQHCLACLWGKISPKHMKHSIQKAECNCGILWKKPPVNSLGTNDCNCSILCTKPSVNEAFLAESRP